MGITERAVMRIVSELENDGVIERIKVGRRNQYVIQTDHPLHHQLENHTTIGELIKAVS
ncbi:winged helix-turn-helix domain-containing protein [bacterium]|nr:winged helix-turn-helix domain-containing protein [bacterium]